VASLNGFSAPRTTFGTHSFNNQISQGEDDTICGIWILPSRINHSCLGNCERSFIGDMQIVRASQDLPANTELSFPYKGFSPTDTYEETQKVLSGWGFTCDCLLCRERKLTTEQMILKRNALRRELEATLIKDMGESSNDSAIGSILLTEGPGLLKQIKATYPETQGSVRVALSDGYFAIGHMLLAHNRPREAAEVTIKGLEALGYDIIACPPQSGTRKLEIRRWGQSEDDTVVAFMQLQKAYMIIAPELSAKANRYARTAYSICYGSDVTIEKVYPKLGRVAVMTEMMARWVS
jgi:Fe-S oxidoreductase